MAMVAKAYYKLFDNLNATLLTNHWWVRPHKQMISFLKTSQTMSDNIFKQKESFVNLL